MRTPALRHVVTVILTGAVLTTLFACGEERHARECVARCETEFQECEHRHERECEGRKNHCFEECKRAREVHER